MDPGRTRRGSSKLRKLCARWPVIAAKALVMMTLRVVSLSVLPIKNLYKHAAEFVHIFPPPKASSALPAIR